MRGQFRQVNNFENPFGKLESWRIENFKAIEKGEIQFPGLTVLLGANSAGKSSVIQSLLSLAQVLDGNFGNRFPLVGELARLGSVDQASRNQSGSFKLHAQFSYGQLEIEVTGDEYSKYQAPYERPFEGLEGQIKSVKMTQQFQNCIFEIDQKPINNSLENDLAMGNISRKDVPLANYEITGSYPCIGNCSSLNVNEPHSIPLGLTLKWDPASKTIRIDENFRFGDYATLESSLLGAIEKVFESGTESAEDFLSSIGRAKDIELRASEQLADLLLGKLAIANSHEDALGILVSELQLQSASKIWRLLMLLDDVQLGSIPKSLGKKIENLNGLIKANDQFEMDECWDSWLDTYNGVLDSFVNSFRYLGPLRQDPQIVHSPLPSKNTHLPMGRNGENTTQVIWQVERERGKTPFINADGSYSFSLGESLDSWLEYLELGTGVSFINLGNAGFETLVGGMPIYSLGTGVSQLLPVLAICLTETTDALIVIEQPELHLHPSSQQKLADFFIAMSQAGRRMLLETHSEYLITRLRRRVAVDELKTRSYLLLFVEKDGDKAIFKPSKLRDTGQFSYWPKGFFGQVEEDLLAIMEADIRRTPE